jgi:hypothetical protein
MLMIPEALHTSKGGLPACRSVLLKGLLVNLKRNGFESDRIEQILRSAPPLAATGVLYLHLRALGNLAGQLDRLACRRPGFPASVTRFG